MLEKINGKKIELMPKIPKEDEKICDTCGGTGWLYNKKYGYIQVCTVCYSGIIPLCPLCGEPKRGMCMNKECRAIRDAESEEKALSKAIKAEYKDVPLEHKEMLYSEKYDYNEGYFTDVGEFIDYCKDNDIEVPKYVWSTTKIGLSIDAGSVIESACDDLHEDAYQNITDEKGLQEFLDAWCAKQTGTDTYTADYKYAITI